MPNKYIDDFDEFYEKAIYNPTNEIYNYGKISNKLSNEIKKITGTEVSEYRLQIQNYQLRHILKRHGDLSKSNSRVSKETIRNINEILKNFDRIQLGYKKNNSDRIEITLKVNGTLVVIEEISNPRKRTLWIKTIFISTKKE
jgi:hypothetical protein